MRLFPSASVGVLSLLLGISTVHAQEEKPRPEESRPEPNRQEEAKPAQQNNEMKPEQNKAPKEEKPPKEEKKEQQKEQKEESKASHQEAQPSDRGHEHGQDAGTARNAPARNGRHIPDDQFRQRFGRQHTLVINRPVIIEGQPRFQYSGYWFVIADPWPAEWAYTDDCYIDYVDGDYFLFDLLHPGLRVALFVAM